MTVPGNINALLLGGQRGYQIERSLRFNNADSAYLSKGSTLSGNRRLHTLSFWVKRAGLGSRQTLFGNTDSSGFGGLYFEFDGNDALLIGDYTTGWVWQLNTTARYRDPSAWYHIVFAVDTTNATASSRARLYVNGIEVTAFSTASYMSQNYDTYWNYNASAIGRLGDYNGQYFSGYLTEVHFIDGQALTPSSFGETDTITGVWKPKRYSGTYGTNGYYLKFADNSGTTSTTLGKDSSGNGNNWTPNNFSVTAGVDNDSMIDTPTPYADGGNGRGNYCTLNPVSNFGLTLQNGNLYSTSTAGYQYSNGTISLPNSGKFYFEYSCTNTAGANLRDAVGFAKAGKTLTAGWSGLAVFLYAYQTAGYSLFEGAVYTPATIYSSLPTATNGDVISVAVDCSNGYLWFAKNGTWVNSGNPAAGTGNTGYLPSPVTDWCPAVGVQANVGGYPQNGYLNFGQRPFAYTPPSGFLALNTQNLPEPSIKKPSSYMDVKLYTGNGGTQTISGLGFSPDLVWIKCRSAANTHALVDSIRGATKYLVSASTAAEVTDSGGIASLNSDGFSLTFPTSTAPTINANSATYVAWCWDESATPGFDIVTYTGDGVSNRTVSHALGVAPAMIIIKDRDTNSNANNWFVWHQSLSSGNNIQLEKTDPAYAVSSTGGGGIGTSPSSSTFTLLNGSSSNVNTNENGDRFVAYLWSEVAGFSKFGSYTGNGSSDGPFVFCGFRPRFVMIKGSSFVSNWNLLDASRNSYNVSDLLLRPNLADAEFNSISLASGFAADFLSNGFKLRVSLTDSNSNGQTFVFAAFAENPFKYSLAR